MKLCFCIAPRVGVYCVATFKIVVSFVILNMLIYFPEKLFMYAPWYKAGSLESEEQKTLALESSYIVGFITSDKSNLDIVMTGLIFCVLRIIINALLIVAVHNIIGLFWPWLIFSALEIPMALICLIHALVKLAYLALVFAFLLAVHIYIYFFVIKFYRKIRRND